MKMNKTIIGISLLTAVMLMTSCSEESLRELGYEISEAIECEGGAGDLTMSLEDFSSKSKTTTTAKPVQTTTTTATTTAPQLYDDPFETEAYTTAAEEQFSAAGDEESRVLQGLKTSLQYIKDGNYQVFDNMPIDENYKLVAKTAATLFSDEYLSSASFPDSAEQSTLTLCQQMKEFDVIADVPIISEDGNSAEVLIIMDCICYADYVRVLQIVTDQMQMDSQYNYEVMNDVANFYFISTDAVTTDLLAAYFLNQYAVNSQRKNNSYTFSFSLYKDGNDWVVYGCDNLSKFVRGLTMGINDIENGNIIGRNSPDNTNNDVEIFDVNIFDDGGYGW